MTRVLCLAEDPADSSNLEGLLDRLGYESRFFTDPESASRAISAGTGEIALVVCQRPHQFGLELLGRVDTDTTAIPIVVLAGEGDVDHAVLSMRSGAADYLPMPVRVEVLAMALEHARTMANLRSDRRKIRREAAGPSQRRLVGNSHQMHALRHLIAMVAVTEATVLVMGESGTGKELVAQSIHAQSRRAERPFVAINCAALAEGLVESTLFGHEKGAFTGATQRQLGAFERAATGTLFLDEVSEMRPDLQAKLLRVIQESEIERVGGRETIRTDVRLIASTNRDLREEVRAGRFRADLYYRLHVMPIRTAPLRERPDDIPELIGHAMQAAATTLGLPLPPLRPDAMARLSSHDWPGNVRELMNAAQRALIMAQGREVRFEDFQVEPLLTSRQETLHLPAPAHDLPINLVELETQAINRALEQTGGVRSRAAQLLGISERTLRNRLNPPLSA